MPRTAWLACTVLLTVPVFVFRTAPAQTVTGQQDVAVSSSVCAACHPAQSNTFRRTGMGRSFYRPSPANQIEDFSRGLPFYHEASATYFDMAMRNGHYYQSQYQIGFDGKKTSFTEKQVDYVVGSGNHARTYLSRTPRNLLVELPLAWYSEKGGYWAMNPGYDRPDHEGFNRTIETNCMFCHNAYPDIQNSTKTSGGEAIFPSVLPEGIDCQRCHGPGRAHVLAARTGGVAANIRAAIVNPARLAPERQMEVCLQCHLETTSFPLPNALRRYERGPFSYRSGERLSDFRLEFDQPSGTRGEDDFEIAGAAYQLGKSACLLSSGGKLSCTTCHNPHDVRHGAEAAQKYNAVCRSCHGAPLDSLSAAGRHPTSVACVDCHMPKRRTLDAVHVVMTDHQIRRTKTSGDLLAEIPERQHNGVSAYKGEVLRYRHPSLAGQKPERPDDELYVAGAQVIQSSNLTAGIARLAAAIRQFQPQNADHYATLADALRASGRCDQAIAMYEEALRRRPKDTMVIQKMVLCLTSTGQHAQAEAAVKVALGNAPDEPKLYGQLGAALVGQGRIQEGIAALEKATTMDAGLPEVWNYLGELRTQFRDPAGAETDLRHALQAQPNYAAAHVNLGSLLSTTNRFEEAKYHFELALHYRPDDALAHFRYGLALGRVRRYPDARLQLQESLQADPKNAEAHHALGLVFDAEDNLGPAIEHYREAVNGRAGYSLANLSLGWALIRSGKSADGIPFVRTAAESSEAPIRERAQSLLNQYAKP